MVGCFDVGGSNFAPGLPKVCICQQWFYAANMTFDSKASSIACNASILDVSGSYQGHWMSMVCG